MKWSLVRRHYDHRDNAAIIVDCSNVTPFRWKTGFFYCASCELASAEFDVIKQHTLTHFHQTESRSIFNKQIYLKVEVTGLKCELCSESIEDIEKLFEHLIEQHNKPLIKDYGIGVLPFVISGSEYNCIKCDESFKFFSHLNKHANIHYPNTVCPLCGKSFVYRHRMQTHMKTHEIDGTGTEQLKCPKCDLTFTTRYERAKHVAKHNIYKNRCQYCNESFKSHPAKLKHLREFHDKKINYPCSFCPAVFGACNFRTKHVAQVHKVEKTYSCELCPFASVTSSQLRAHMIKHSGEKKHQCQVCKKAYARRYTLREHMRIHENDRRFACMYCNSAFVQKCSLKSHMKTHHPNESMEPLLDLKPFEKLEDQLPPPPPNL